MQGPLSALQTELAGRSIEVLAGGGVVKVRVDGSGRVRHLAIEQAAFEGRDPDLLADLILGAIAEAQRRADEVAAIEAKRVVPPAR
jgi:hypothetical protein